jgi:hypothetical protein
MTAGTYLAGSNWMFDSARRVGQCRRTLIKYGSDIDQPSGAIAQLGERIVRNDEVVGSIPTSSTNLLNSLAASSAVLYIVQPLLLYIEGAVAPGLHRLP